jgi:hypothetical protein
MPHKNPEDAKRYRLEHYLRNRERVKARVAARRATEDGLQKARAATKAWKQANPRAALAQKDREALRRPGLSRDWGVRILAVIPDERRWWEGEIRGLQRVHEERLRRLRDGTAPGMTRAERFKAKYRNNPEFALNQRLRNQLKKATGAYGWVAHYFGNQARRQTGGQIWAVVGYSAQDLRSHLERQFTRGMSWERLQAGDIHIDHIVPKSTFDLDTLEDVRACFALTNLRPLWASDNLRKQARRTHLC